MDKQYRRILVPLDGSEVAKSAVPVAAGMGRLFDSELTLITVLPESTRLSERVPVGTEAAANGAAQSPGNAGSDAVSYLEDVAGRLRHSGVQANTAAVFNTDPATEIVLTARDRQFDLIIMASRGRSGFVRGLLGSVTDRVIHSSPIPVMVVPAGGDPGTDRWTFSSVIVPLDGSDLAETALPHVECISRAANAPITLIRAAPFPTMYGGDPYGGLPTGVLAIAEDDEKRAKHYLVEIATRLRARGRTVETHVGSGHPRSEITQIAQDMTDAIVVMTTRGTSGLTRWVVGSVADSVIRSSGVPVLVVPPSMNR
ncbi:MAG: universal stress protein [Chloroflexi bacterium]|nr:universal stress protein [Chloroflexota bacterium]